MGVNCPHCGKVIEIVKEEDVTKGIDAMVAEAGAHA